MIYEKFKELYSCHKYQEYIDLFNENTSDIFAYGFLIAINYIFSLIYTNEYELAYETLEELSNFACIDKDYFGIALSYYYIGKPDKALHSLENINKPSPKKMYLLAKIYLLKGEIWEAEQYINYLIHYYRETKYAKSGLELQRKINNHYEQGAFIEIEYSSFLKQGNHLEPGYIVYLRDSQELSENYIMQSKKSNIKKPYLIIKIEGDTLYLAPITRNYNTYRYRLYSTDYPNSTQDRYVLNAFCTTKATNILSISDKLKEKDLENSLEFIITSMYFSKNIALSSKKEFYNFFIGEGLPGEVIALSYDPTVRKVSYYYIIESDDENYYGYEVSFPIFSIKSEEIVKIPKEIPLYKRFGSSSVPEETKKRIRIKTQKYNS